MADFDEKNKTKEPEIKTYDEELPLATAKELYQDLGIKPKIHLDLENRQFNFLVDRTQDGKIETHPVMNDKGLVYVFDLDKWDFVVATDAGENILDPVADHVKEQIDASVEQEPDLGPLDDSWFDDSDLDEAAFAGLEDLDEEFGDFDEKPEVEEPTDYTALAMIAQEQGKSLTDFRLWVRELEIHNDYTYNYEEFSNLMEIAWHEAINEKITQELNNSEIDEVEIIDDLSCISLDLI